MQWKNAYMLALAWGVFSSPPCAAFTVHHQQVRTLLKKKRSSSPSPSPLFVGGGLGWDNENYLEALGRGEEALEKANQEYEALSRFGRRPGRPGEDEEEEESIGTGVPGAVLTDEMKARMRAYKDDETEEEGPSSASQGGQMFREMMARAQQNQGRPTSLGAPPSFTDFVPPPPPALNMPPPPTSSIPQSINPYAQQMQPPIPPPPPMQMQMPSNPESLTVEQQAELFRQMMAAQQQPPQVVPPPPLPQSQEPVINPQSLPRKTAPMDGRRAGRNRDADAIVNTSDVYFAQLKLDSTIRNYARYGGDDEKANAVFEDPSIQQIQAHVNPYLEETRKKEAELLEMATDEMLLLEEIAAKKAAAAYKPPSYAGVSYKEKLEQQRKLRAKQEQEQQASSSVSSSPTNAPAASTSAASAAAAKPEAAAAATPVGSVGFAPPVVVTAKQVSPGIATTATSTTTTTSTPSNNPSTSTTSSYYDTSSGKVNEELLRKDIRTFMGLLLKHRGGPGFGAGRLQGTQVHLFHQLAQQLMAHLRREQQQHANNNQNNQNSIPNTPVSSSTSFSSSSLQQPAPLADDGNNNRVQGMITCIEGGIQMYRNCPPELRDSVLATFRVALLSAVNTVSEILELTSEPVVPPTTAQQQQQQKGMNKEERIQSMISLIEGAIVMHKNSPPELAPSILVTLRAALLSGIGTINGIIANNEVQNLQAYQQQVAAAATTQPSSPSGPFYDVGVVQSPSSATVATTTATPTTDASAPSAPAYDGLDENSKFFEQLHAKLEKAKGEGKMGLRTDLTSAAATDLADDLFKMRALLVQELEDGIPSPTSSSESTSNPSSSSAASKYQQMLAKARAEGSTS